MPQIFATTARRRPFLFSSAVAAMIAGSALAQTTQPPPADPLAVKPVPSQAQTPDSDAIRTKIEQAGYTAVTDVSRDSVGVWRARGRKGNEAVDIVVDKGGRIKSEPR
ncbi:MAG: hypothetical protein GEV13_19970 [Rhodospirillales bacterium]|nr:hypothetical protein [Rhodospirillales bacterium]